jgi:prepilin-type N-terminal cleavage/methylation domain-containing protein
MRDHKFQKKISGFTLVELLVAVIIGLLSIYAVYTVYEQNVRVNQSTSSVSNLQMSGVQAMFVLRQVLTDAGSSFLQDNEFDALLNCPDTPGTPSETPSEDNLEGSLYLDKADSGVPGKVLSLRPLPVVLDERTPGTSEQGNIQGRYDQIFAFAGASSVYGLIPTNIISSQAFNAGSQDIYFSKLPFSLKERDILVGVDDNAHTCAPYYVETVNTSTNNDVVIGQTPMTATKIVDLGNMSRFRFWVDTDRNNTLMMERYTLESDSNSIVWKRVETPLVSNVQDFIVQYGIDIPDGTSNVYDNVVDAWVDPADETWSEENLRMAGFTGGQDGPLTKEDIQSIKAVRIGIVVRTDRPDQLSYKEYGCSSSSCTYSDVLFGTQQDTKMTSTKTSSITETVPFSCDLKYGDGSQKVAYHCRKYETIIPVRNAVWNWQ